MGFALASRSSSKQPAPVVRALRRRAAGTTVRMLAWPEGGIVGSGPAPAATSRAPAIRTKLKVGAPNDRFEQEADRVADQVMRMADPRRTGPIHLDAKATPRGVQRLCAECEEEVRRQPAEDEEEELRMKRASGATAEVGSDVQTPISGLHGGGQLLSPALRGFFEPRFGHDFGHVRLHTDQRAADSARTLNALAYTVGDHIVFGAGQSATVTSAGRRLLAHELTHTIHQGDRGGPSTSTLQHGIGAGDAVITPKAKEKGEDEDLEAKIKRRPAIRFSVVQYDQPPPVGVEGKRQACPVPGPAAQRHRELDATAAQIGGMDACTWGITVPDDLGIATETCRDGADWRLVVTRVNSVIRTHSRLLAGQAEPVPGVNTNAGNFCDQVTELDNLGDCAGAWYMIRAVRAHEDVHVDEWRDNFTADWTPLETAIEALTVPAAGATADRAAATAALRADVTFTDARDTGNGGGNFPTFWAIADPNANTDAAERAVVDPRIRWICRHAGWQGWDPSTCPVCVAQGLA